MKRRKFIQNTSAGLIGGLSGAPIIQSCAATSKMRNGRLEIGVIGCNGMGWSNVKALLQNADVDLVAICDADNNVIDKRIEEYKEFRTNEPARFSDYRKLLDEKSIDAVVIGTPDHWHAKMMVDAVQAGKHVYVEKPIANTIEECNIMLDAAEKTGKVVQVGQWQRSGPHYRKAIDIVQSGVLGKIRLVKVWAYQGWMKPVPIIADSAVPAGVDYQSWLGPAPKRAFNKNRFHFNFRWFWDYAGGLMTDWGVHEIDIALYAMNAIAPKSVMATGGKLAYPDDASETPDTLQALFEYDDFNMLWEHATGIDSGPYGRTEGIAFIGNNGTVVVNRGGYEVIVEKGKMESIEKFERPEGVSYLGLHCKNFVDAIKANDPSMLNTHIKSGSVAAINTQMGNIAYKTGTKVFWDKDSGSFKNNEAANKLIKAKYHNGLLLPVA